MKKLIFTAILLLFCSLSYSQWISNYGNIPGDVNFANAKGNSVTSDANGFSYVTGYIYDPATLNDIVVIKYTPEGDTVWVRTFNGNDNQNDEGMGICVDSDGCVYVVGAAQYTGKAYDVVIVKYSSDGVEQWAMAYHEIDAALNDKGVAITVDNNSNIYITGYATGQDGKKDIITAKYDRYGNTIWSRVEDGNFAFDSEGSALKVNANGDVYVTGYVTTSANNADIAVLKYNSNGEKQWLRVIDGGVSQEDKAWGIVIDETDNIYISGYATMQNRGTDYYTAKLDNAGNVIWSKTYDGGGNQGDKAWGIVVDTDGCIYVTGEATDAYNNINYVTINYLNSGVENWIRSYDGTGHGTDIPTSIGIMTIWGYKFIIVTGKSWGTEGNYDYATVRYYAPYGYQTQVNRYSYTGNSDDMATDLAITNTSKILVTGASQLVFDNSYSSYISTIEIVPSNDVKNFGTNENTTPEYFTLHQNYPNPFNPSTVIKFELSQNSQIKLAVYDILGKELSVIVNDYLTAGSYSFTYTNSSLSSGVYFYELTSGSHRDIKKMTLIK